MYQNRKHCYNNNTLNFYFYKLDADTQCPVQGACFALLEEGQIIQESCSNNRGIVQFCHLKPGCYILKETMSPVGYQNNHTLYDVVVYDCGYVTIDGQPACDFCSMNQAITVDFEFEKIDAATGAPLAGASFVLCLNKTTAAIATSNTSGRIQFANIKSGQYQLYEIAVPLNYKKNPVVYDVLVTENGLVSIGDQLIENFKIGNIPQSAAFTFLKTDALSELGLEGAVFELRQNNIPVRNAVSNTSGLVDFGVLPSGVYTLHETIPPPNYSLNGHSYTVAISDNGSITVDGQPLENFSIANMPQTFSFFFLKTIDGTLGEPLPNAAFTLYDSTSNDPVATATSNADGIVLFENLPPGSYYAIETAVPGLTLTDSPLLIEIGSDGQTTINGQPAAEYVAVNERQTTEVVGRKVWNDRNNTTNIRPSTTTILLLQNGVAIGSTVINNAGDGSFIFDNLPLFDPEGIPYTYTVQEATVPAGYTVSVDEYTITNDLKIFYILVRYIDTSSGTTISSTYHPVYAGGSITIYPPIFVGYYAPQPTVQSLTNVMEDMEVFFYYSPI